MAQLRQREPGAIVPVNSHAKYPVAQAVCVHRFTYRYLVPMEDHVDLVLKLASVILLPNTNIDSYRIFIQGEYVNTYEIIEDETCSTRNGEFHAFTM